MKCFILTLALVALAHGLPQQQVRQRGAKQLDTNYGAPEQSDESAPAPAIYGGPAAGSLDALASAPQATYAGAAAGEAEGQDGLDSQPSELDPQQESGAGAREGEAGGDPIAMLKDSIPGTPGEDYPIYAEAPETKFTCDSRVNGGYYADSEAECQAFHICSADGQGGLTKYSFLCPNGTIFNQEYFICDWWFNVDCSKAEALATSRNAELEAARSEAEARIAAESNSLDTAASDASESVSNYGAPKTAEAPLANYASEDSNDAASSDLAPISNYGSQ